MAKTCSKCGRTLRPRDFKCPLCGTSAGTQPSGKTSHALPTRNGGLRAGGERKADSKKGASA